MRVLALVPSLPVLMAAATFSCATAPRSMRERYLMSEEEERHCGQWAEGLAREEDRVIGRQPADRERFRFGLEQCRHQLVEVREATLAPPLKLGLTAMACLSMGRMIELSQIRKEEDARRQAGERVERRAPAISEDSWQRFQNFATARLANKGGECGTVETIDTAECMRSQLEHAAVRPSSCGLAYVTDALDALRIDMQSHAAK
jgi:hypothetical protein